MAWLILAGRGWGKTRTGAEFLADGLTANRGWRGALVAQAFDDGRDTMVEGESGLQVVLEHRKVVYKWNRSLGQIELANGSRADIYSSERPKQLRGPQHHIAWGDEPAYWKDAPLGDAENTTWSNLKLGLRLGDNPQAVLTTTPLPNKLIKLLIGESNIVATRGSTYENLDNLSPKFRREVVQRYEGTRLGQQELYAEILSDIEGALWRREMIRYDRAPLHGVAGELVPDYLRVVVAIDPAVTYGPDSDETGIIVAGKGSDGRGYVIDDQSGRFSPHDWAKRAIAAYREYKADAIVAEVNNGGDLVEANLRASGFSDSYRAVHASRGKRVRAEPISGRYEQGKISHLRPFVELEDQLCNFTPDSLVSPDRLDALVWAFTDLFQAEDSGSDFSMIA